MLDKNIFPTKKVAEIKAFIETNNIDILAVSESGLHGKISRIMRTNPINNDARIIFYVNNSVTIKEIKTPANISDLPIILILARKSKGPQTLISTHYREFTGGISGIGSPEYQVERLKRIVEHWNFLDTFNKETVIISNTNLCHSKWNNTSNPQKLSRMPKQPWHYNS